MAEGRMEGGVNEEHPVDGDNRGAADPECDRAAGSHLALLTVYRSFRNAGLLHRRCPPLHHFLGLIIQHDVK
jgi:hypothetical protein